jgi:hypothetical protein
MTQLIPMQIATIWERGRAVNEELTVSLRDSAK